MAQQRKKSLDRVSGGVVSDLVCDRVATMAAGPSVGPAGMDDRPVLDRDLAGYAVPSVHVVCCAEYAQQSDEAAPRSADWNRAGASVQHRLGICEHYRLAHCDAGVDRMWRSASGRPCLVHTRFSPFATWLTFRAADETAPPRSPVLEENPRHSGPPTGGPLFPSA